MLTPKELQRKAERYWTSGRALRAWLGDGELFPIQIPAGRPSASQLLKSFNEVGDWKRSLEKGCRETTGRGYRIEYAEINHRQFGRQRLPGQLIFDGLEDLLGYLRKQREFERFVQLQRMIVQRQPALGQWIERYPIKMLEQADHWPRLLAVVDFFVDNPHPERYLRELLIPAVDSKFIEQRKGLIAELLDRVLPSESIDSEVTGLARHGFERRYGLNYDQPLIRFRLLEARTAKAYGGLNDLTIPLDRFIKLDPPVKRVFITENKINGLSFPCLPDSMIIFGLGYGISSLKPVDWLHQREIHYWGDIDTHGFAILSQLRSYFPQVNSMLMERKTLETFSHAWGREESAKRTTAELEHLGAEEQACYRLLCDNRLGENVRLEQERIPFDWLKERLAAFWP